MDKMDQTVRTNEWTDEWTEMNGREWTFPCRVDARARRSSLWYLADVLAVSEATPPATKMRIMSTDTHLSNHTLRMTWKTWGEI